MSTRALINWFDRQETVLAEEAKLAGLLSHNTTIGQAREFLISRFLKSILPPAIHFGTGKIIDSSGNYSKQIDIIIYDPRFPILEIAGGGLYLVEGVIAAIEVKSTINSEQLTLALDNCKSVLSLKPEGEDPEERDARIAFYRDRNNNMSNDDAVNRFIYNFLPETYIFGFTSDLTCETTFNNIHGWWNDINEPKSPKNPYLPKMIVTGNSVGISNDGFLTINIDDPTNDIDNQIFFHFFETDLRFRWLALHIVNKVSSRLGIKSYGLGGTITYRITGYFPMEEYTKALNNGKFIRHLNYKTSSS